MNSLRSGSYTEPDYSMALAKVQHMNKDELNELLNNDAKMDDYIKSLDQASTIKSNPVQTCLILTFTDKKLVQRKRRAYGGQ